MHFNANANKYFFLAYHNSGKHSFFGAPADYQEHTFISLHHVFLVSWKCHRVRWIRVSTQNLLSKTQFQPFSSSGLLRYLTLRSVELACFFSAINPFATTSAKMYHPPGFDTWQGHILRCHWSSRDIFGITVRNTQTRKRKKRWNFNFCDTQLLEVRANLFPHFSNDISKADNEAQAICDTWDNSLIYECVLMHVCLSFSQVSVGCLVCRWFKKQTYLLCMPQLNLSDVFSLMHITCPVSKVTDINSVQHWSKVILIYLPSSSDYLWRAILNPLRKKLVDRLENIVSHFKSSDLWCTELPWCCRPCVLQTETCKHSCEILEFGIHRLSFCWCILTILKPIWAAYAEYMIVASCSTWGIFWGLLKNVCSPSTDSFVLLLNEYTITSDKKHHLIVLTLHY